MSNPSLLLQEGASALKQGDYATAVRTLQAFCESPVPTESKAYLQGHKWLVQAYVKRQETELALEICLKMAQSQAPAAEQWANQAIPQLQQAIAQQHPAPLPDRPVADAPPRHDAASDGADSDAAASLGSTAAELSPEALKQSIDLAVKAFRQGNNAEAIERLEPLISAIEPQCNNYGRAQMTLAKAYKAEQETEKAISVGKTLMASERNDISIWGKQFLHNLGALAEASPAADHSSLGIDSEIVPETGFSQDLVRPNGSHSTVSGSSYPPSAEARPGGRLSSPSTSSISMSSPRSSQRSISQRDPNDYTPVLQAAFSHGSITFILSWLLYLLFPTWVALCLDLLRWAVPVVIYCNATDPIAKANAKEATNYVITMLIILVLSLGGSIFLGLAFLGLAAVLGPLLILVAIPLAIYCLVLSFYPVVGTIICLSNPDKTFRYPRWLIWHVV